MTVTAVMPAFSSPVGQSHAMLTGHAAQILFALAFFVCRVALGPFVVYYTLQSSTSHPVVKVCPQSPIPSPILEVEETKSNRINRTPIHCLLQPCTDHMIDNKATLSPAILACQEHAIL